MSPSFCCLSYFLCLCIHLEQWFPTGGSRPQSGSRWSFCGDANSSLNSLLKSRNFELRVSTFCYISKTETRTDLCEVHIISIIIPILFLLHSLNQPDCKIESYAERVNPRGLRVPAFAEQVLEPVLLCMRGGRRMGNSLFVWATECEAKAHELNQLKNRKTRGCTKVVSQQCA